MKNTPSTGIEWGIALGGMGLAAALLLTGCGKSIEDRVSVRLGNQSEEAAPPLEDLPPGVGSITCQIYDLKAHFRAQGCEISDSLSDTESPNYAKLTACGMRLPDFATLRPVGVLLWESIDLEESDYREAIRGMPSHLNGLNEYMGLSCSGGLLIEREGKHHFKLRADDGARFYLNGKLVINNDGMHAPRTRGKKVKLAQGVHRFRVDWYQGPRWLRALQLIERTDGRDEVIAPSRFSAE